MADQNMRVNSMELFDETFVGLHGAIDRATKKQAIIAQNIANANNPDYEALEFDAALDKAVKRQGKKQVIIEDEMAAMSKNNIDHSAYIKMLAAKISVLRTVVTQGRK